MSRDGFRGIRLLATCTMLRSFPDSLVYDQKLQDTDHAYLFSSEKALGSLAENYVGLPF